MNVRRARWRSKCALCCTVLTIYSAASDFSAAHAGVVLSTNAGFYAVKLRRFALLVQVQSQPAELKVSNIDGLPGRPIPLNIEVLAVNTTDQLFIFTGIPEGVTLNPGGYFGKFWAVNPKVISALTLTAPPDFSGSFTVGIARRGEGTATTASASFNVTIRNPAAPAAAATASIAASSSSPGEAPKAVRKPNPNEPTYMARGKTLLESGDISAARAVFENLALQGSAAGAMALGETYDPLVLRKLLIKGLEADAEKARAWYLKAEELGGPDARRRLNELAGR